MSRQNKPPNDMPKDLTNAQFSALCWLNERGGIGIFDNHNVLVAAGEKAPIMRSTWNVLRDKGYIGFSAKNDRRVNTLLKGLGWKGYRVLGHEFGPNFEPTD